MEGDIYGSTSSGHQKISSHICFLYCPCYTIPHLQIMLFFCVLSIYGFQKQFIDITKFYIVVILYDKSKDIVRYPMISTRLLFYVYSLNMLNERLHMYPRHVWNTIEFRSIYHLCHPCQKKRVISVKSNIIFQIYSSSIYETVWRHHNCRVHCSSDNVVTRRLDNCHIMLLFLQ